MDRKTDKATRFGGPGKKTGPLPPGLDNDPPSGGVPPQNWRPLIWYFVFMAVFLWIWQEASRQLITRTIPYSEFKSLVAERKVADVEVSESDIIGKFVATNAPRVETNSAHALEPAATSFRTVRVDDPDLTKDLEKAGVKFAGVRPSGISQLLWAWIIPLAAMLLIWSMLSRRMSGIGQSLMNIGSSKAKLVPETDSPVTFNDVAGCDEAKYELQEVVSFLKNPARYSALGATVPKGILLVGAPGTGKTLLARAVAGEAKVPFFLISGSDFVEMFVGVGAARVRSLFEKAKAQAPCIVFIDELDAVGRQRGVHMGVVNDEREQTLNQLLVGMDGFEANVGVIILAATNRPEVLDRALLRPGRFDRQVVVDAPDLEGRLAILKLHVRNKPLADGGDLRRIAQQTPGFSGADLANVLNEAALLAARHNAKQIGQKDLEDAVEKVVAGPERKSRRLNEEEKKRVAYHEVGHALVAAHSKFADEVHKISIIPHGHAALGYTMQLPSEDHYLVNRSALAGSHQRHVGGPGGGGRGVWGSQHGRGKRFGTRHRPGAANGGHVRHERRRRPGPLRATAKSLHAGPGGRRLAAGLQ